MVYGSFLRGRKVTLVGIAIRDLKYDTSNALLQQLSACSLKGSTLDFSKKFFSFHLLIQGIEFAKSYFRQNFSILSGYTRRLTKVIIKT